DTGPGEVASSSRAALGDGGQACALEEINALVVHTCLCHDDAVDSTPAHEALVGAQFASLARHREQHVEACAVETVGHAADHFQKQRIAHQVGFDRIHDADGICPAE